MKHSEWNARNVSNNERGRKGMRKIELIKEEELEERFYNSLKEHKLPDYFLYLGAPGVKNWVTLDRSEKFTVAAQLTELLRESMPFIGRLIPPGMNVVSLGVGSGEKERIILDELSRRSDPFYFPVDISSQMVDIALETVRDIPVEKLGLVGFFEDMPLLKRFWRAPVILCMLGNNFCNYEPDHVLKAVHENLDGEDLFLFDCHLFPNAVDKESIRKKIEAIYRSKENVSFNVGPLLRCGMDPENVAFQLDLLPTQTLIGAVYRTHKRVNIRKDTTINCGSGTVNFEAGDTIQLGFTYKYTAGQIEALLRQYNFTVLRMFLSSDRSNLLVLARKHGLNEED